jgi:hypothetical protein
VAKAEAVVVLKVGQAAAAVPPAEGAALKGVVAVRAALPAAAAAKADRAAAAGRAVVNT